MLLYAKCKVLVEISFYSEYFYPSISSTYFNEKFLPGLWQVCLNNFQDIHRFYDTRFTGCMWVRNITNDPFNSLACLFNILFFGKVFEEEYYIIHDFLLPGFYIATQFFFTLCFTLLLASALMTAAFFGVDRDDDRYIMVLLTNGATQILSC